MAQTMDEFDEKLDKVGTGPRKKTPEEMMQNPMDLLDPDDSEEDHDVIPPIQKPIDEHDWSINDNDSKNGPAR